MRLREALLHLGELRQKCCVLFRETLGVALCDAAPATERDCGKYEAQHQKNSAPGNERHVERDVWKLRHDRKSCELRHATTETRRRTTQDKQSRKHATGARRA